MNHAKNEKFILMLVTFSCIGLTVEGTIMHWEFWVPPIVVIAACAIWAMKITDRPEYGLRKVCYMIYAMFAIFYHGVHDTSFFDVALVVSLVMVAFSFLDHLYMMNLLLAEYFAIMLIQIFLARNRADFSFDSLNLSRLILHVAIVILVYLCCVRLLKDRMEAYEINLEKDEKIEAYDADMEDFLSNISHEFRTPVNVVSGMSDLLIKRNVGSEAESIRSAGIRLTYQIEDIQDYTECKRNKVILEEEDYMSTSLINDVVTSFRLNDSIGDLELIVDLDPKVPTMMNGDIKKLHKIFRHLLENAVKFTKTGGIYVKMYAEPRDYGVNLCIEMTDTGIGMGRKATQSVSEGMYQVNKKRNRSSGGIGLGLFIVHGFAHRMGGFVKIESEKGIGTTVRVTLPQKTVDDHPCLALADASEKDILFHVRSDKYKVPRVRDFYRAMAANLASGVHAPLYPAQTIREIERLMEKLNVGYIFMGQEEYEENPDYFDEMSRGDIVVAVSAGAGFRPQAGSNVLVMPKHLYAYPVIKILNEGKDAAKLEYADNIEKPNFTGVRALIVDDEPMNLVVATGLFRDYEMVIDTAGSGIEAIGKCRDNEYDVVFMDHMMPEMDGVEAMKQIRRLGAELKKDFIFIALTANAVSGAREMFIREGFDGFIAKPINTADFERVMLRTLPASITGRGGVVK
ncbi:MAG: response regulator [Lachnospiraceae bacterium]|nr:response regulator [Lachnospiraceae bacterium]